MATKIQRVYGKGRYDGFVKGLFLGGVLIGAGYLLLKKSSSN